MHSLQTIDITGAAFHLAAAWLLVVAACGSQPEGNTQTYRDYNPSDANTQDSPDGQALECVPDLDGELEASEFEPVLGVEARYIVSPPGAKRDVDLEGEQTPTGKRRWDWSYTSDSSRSVEIVARAVDDRWYADRFPEDAFVLPLRLSGELEGIYRKTDAQMLLLGIASSTKNPGEGKTFLKYDEPVVVYKFPLKAGRSWVSESEVKDGTLRGLPYNGTDTYEVEVRAQGEMILPNFTFDQVFRVDTKVTVKAAAGGAASRRQVSYLTECFGEIARARSPNGVTKPDFEAVEVRRLGSR